MRIHTDERSGLGLPDVAGPPCNRGRPAREPRDVGDASRIAAAGNFLPSITRPAAVVKWHCKAPLKIGQGAAKLRTHGISVAILYSSASARLHSKVYAFCV